MTHLRLVEDVSVHSQTVADSSSTLLYKERWQILHYSNSIALKLRLGYLKIYGQFFDLSRTLKSEKRQAIRDWGKSKLRRSTFNLRGSAVAERFEARLGGDKMNKQLKIRGSQPGLGNLRKLIKMLLVIFWELIHPN